MVLLNGLVMSCADPMQAIGQHEHIYIDGWWITWDRIDKRYVASK